MNPLETLLEEIKYQILELDQEVFGLRAKLEVLCSLRSRVESELDKQKKEESK
jgi:hypothetical protein